MTDHDRDDVKQIVAETILRRINETLAADGAGPGAGVLGGNGYTATGSASFNASTTSQPPVTIASLKAMVDKIRVLPHEPIRCWRGTVAQFVEHLRAAGFAEQSSPWPAGSHLFGLCFEQFGEYVLIGTAQQLHGLRQKGAFVIEAGIRDAEGTGELAAALLPHPGLATFL